VVRLLMGQAPRLDLAALADKIDEADRALQQEAAEATRLVHEHEKEALTFCRRLIAIMRIVLDEKKSAFPDKGWQVIVMALIVKVVKLTVDTYGKWLPMGNKAAVDRMDDAQVAASGSKTVAAAHAAVMATPEVADPPRVSLRPSTQALQEHARRHRLKGRATGGAHAR